VTPITSSSRNMAGQTASHLVGWNGLLEIKTLRAGMMGTSPYQAQLRVGSPTGVKNQGARENAPEARGIAVGVRSGRTDDHRCMNPGPVLRCARYEKFFGVCVLYFSRDAARFLTDR
jgi:hypothetical protein